MIFVNYFAGNSLFFNLRSFQGTHKNVVYVSLFHTILRRILLFVSATLLHLYFAYFLRKGFITAIFSFSPNFFLKMYFSTNLVLIGLVSLLCFVLKKNFQKK
jgi:hypothetical protein